MVGFLDNQQESQPNAQQTDWLRHIVERVRRSLELPEILNATVAEVRSRLGTDRVMVYRFEADGHGEVIAESRLGDRLPALLGLHFPADDIPPQAREMFLKVRQRSIVSLPDQQIILSQPDHPPTTGDMTVEEVWNQSVAKILQRPVDPCHVEYLTAMGVQSSLVVPIVCQDKLWGLLVSHHADPRSIADADLHLVQLAADQLAVAIAQATLLAQAREKAEREAQINQLVSLLHSQPSLDLSRILDELVNIFNASGGRWWLPDPTNLQGAVYTSGEQLVLWQSDNPPPLEQHPVWQAYFNVSVLMTEHQGLRAMTDLYRDAPMLSSIVNAQASPVRGILVMPLHYRQQLLGYISLFRNEIETETLWAGYTAPDQRQQQPRQSFTAWRELKIGQATPWTATEIELAHSVQHHCSLAIHQHQLYEQVRALNVNLEQQVHERTAQLEAAFEQAIAQTQQLHQLTEQQNALSKVVANIRGTLDLSTVFQTTAREVRQLLNADRVGVFRFAPDSGFDDGEFVSEDVLPGYPSALAAKIHDHCFGEKYAAYYQQGRIQAVADVEQGGLSDCHVQVLSQFQIKANLILPLLKGEDLWGLLCIHQCSTPRQWQQSEIEFAIQIAAQLGVAIQQAELLNQTQQQAEQLSQTLHELQQTQTNLIQTEKMSSLGQLVAGVAHEINNPVNFIYGNLTHAAEYTRDLLELLQLYQHYYPNPANEVQQKEEAIDLQFLTEDLPKMLSSMKVGADRIRQIVLSLRNFSRVDQTAMKPVNIHEGIDSTLLILQYRLKARSDTRAIQLIKEYGNLPLVECYAGQLNQVFMNVLSNAIDALDSVQRHEAAGEDIPHAPIILIQTDVIHSDRALIRIIDNGPGISEKVRAKIFDPFFTTKDVGHGTGLGLSISYQIVVEKHGGQFECISHPGQGTEFRIEIPVFQFTRATANYPA